MNISKENEYKRTIGALKGSLTRQSMVITDLKAHLRLLSRKYNLLQAKYNNAIKGKKDSFKGAHTQLRRQHNKGEIKDFQYVGKINY